MKRLLFLLALPLASFPLHAENIFLRDGSIIEGSIVAESGTTVTLRDSKNDVRRIPRARVLRIVYAKIDINRVHVQKRDGASLLAYMVDEDRDSYTFRKDLQSPEEIRLKREDILFIAGRNIAGLKAEAEFDRLRLSWYPPYDRVEEFRIYVKNAKGETYRKAGTAPGSSYSFNLTGLRSNTKHFVIVTGVDHRGGETPPSNEIEVMTKNRPPGRPAHGRMTRPDGGGFSLAWDAAGDTDGRVEKYRIYLVKGDKKTLLGEPAALTYSIGRPADFDGLFVSAVDERNGESELTRFYSADGRGLSLGFSPGVLYPRGRLGEISAAGYGGSVSLSGRYPFFTAGLESGAYACPGREDERETRGARRVIIAPLYLCVGLRITPFRNLAFIPRLAGGVVYYNMSYLERDPISFAASEKSLSTIGPGAEARLTVEYRMGESWYIILGGSYGGFIGSESGTSYRYAKGEAGVSYRLW